MLVAKGRRLGHAVNSLDASVTLPWQTFTTSTCPCPSPVPFWARLLPGPPSLPRRTGGPTGRAAPRSTKSGQPTWSTSTFKRNMVKP